MNLPDSSGRPARRADWTSRRAVATQGALAALALSGLAIRFLPFHPANQWNVLWHTAGGLALLWLLASYSVRHWREYRKQAVSDVVVLGYAMAAFLALCLASGLVVTAQALFGIRTSAGWRDAHLVSTIGLVAAGAAHVALAFFRSRKVGLAPEAWRGLAWAAGVCLLMLTLPVLSSGVYAGRKLHNRLPADYRYLYGKDRPFAPSLARTSTGRAIDPQSLAGSATCGTSGCHEQILAEWLPSAHRYAAMDTVFQAIQNVMAQQNGPESTRYCGGCHDPISLFSGTKNIFVENLTGLSGYQEGVSCLACHAIRETDIRGNANYTMSQPREYLWQWAVAGPGRTARDFLIRAYPAEHNRLSKRMFKTPEYCAACHKQFIDQEVNRVGWVQLQNQYDNWAASHWNVKGNARRTVECRECHMPLVESRDPAAGDTADYNRSARDGKHRSHRFLAANNFMPEVLQLPGWQQHKAWTEQWLRGEIRIPEIEDKWARGKIVQIAVEAPERVRGGQPVRVRVSLTSNKVGHDFPTGPLDMIQSWVHITARDSAGHTIFESGRVNDDHFIEPGTFLFKAEPVDQHGNLIDRHNLWEMVGVRFRRSLFPGYSDFVDYSWVCPSGSAPPRQKEAASKSEHEFRAPAGAQAGRITVTARLMYRKIDQFLLNYVEGGRSRRTAPVVEIARGERTIEVF
jgi:hypothetical protein